MKQLILIRGLPGSGKSTLAHKLTNESQIWLEADTFFINEDGVYTFDVNKLHAAHKWCQQSTKEWLTRGDTVIVSNTFTTLKEMKPYFEIAKEFGITPVVYHCQNDFGSIHDVPEETMERMRNRWTTDLSPLFDSLT